MANTIMTAKNTFQDALVMDLAPDNTQATCLSNALNATLITMNGNEMSLQNDMGNGRVETAYLPEGYIPVGTCEYGDIIYIASYNPLTNKSQIGCFPSPERNISSEELEETPATLNSTEFIQNGKVINNSVRKIISQKTLNPGDKFIVYSNSLGDSNVIVTDYGNTTENLYTFPKELRISLVAIEDSGKINYLDSTLKWYGTDTNHYYINKSSQNSSKKPDIDSYRNLLNSGYTVFQSKVSGKLAILAELERISGFSCTYDIYKISDTKTNTLTYNNYSVYLNFNWNTSNNDVNPINLKISNKQWVSNIDNIDKSKAGTYSLLTTSETNSSEAQKVEIPEMFNINITFPKNYLQQDKREAYSIYENNNYAKYIEGLKLKKLTQVIDDGIPVIGNYYIDLAQIVDKTYYNSALEIITPEDITDLIVNNFYKGTIYGQIIKSIQIPDQQILEIDGEKQYFNVDKKDLILKFDVTPEMTYGLLTDLTKTLYIDFSKVDSGLINLKGYKYYIGSNLCTLNLNTEIYPEPNKGIEEILLEFYDNQGLCATYHINDRASYSGNITEYIPLNGESTNYKLSALNGETQIYHAGVKDINGTVILNNGKPEQASSDTQEDKYVNDAGILYSNMLYAVKIIIKYRSKNVLGKYEQDNSKDVVIWRWLWTNTMFNDYFYTVTDFANNVFTLDLDIQTNYSSEYKINKRLVYENGSKNLDASDINKGLGSSIQQLNGKINYQLDLGLQNTYEMFNLNGKLSDLSGVFKASTISIYLGQNYTSYDNKQLSTLTTDNYDYSIIEPASQQYDSDLVSDYTKLINNETLAESKKNIWEDSTNYKDMINISLNTSNTLSPINYLGYDQETHQVSKGKNITLSTCYINQNKKESLNIDLWTFNKYLKLFQSTKTDAPIIRSLLKTSNEYWGLNFNKDKVTFKNLYTFSLITLGDDTKDDGSVVTLVDKWDTTVTIGDVKTLMDKRVFYERKQGKYQEDVMTAHKDKAQVRLAYNKKNNGNIDFSPYKDGNFTYFLHSIVNTDSTLYSIEENQFFLNLVYFNEISGSNDHIRFGLSQGDRSFNVKCFSGDNIYTQKMSNLGGQVAAQLGYMDNKGIYLLNDYITISQTGNIYEITSDIAHKLADLLADSYILSTSDGTIDIDTLLEFIHYNYKTIFTQDVIFSASVKSDNSTLCIQGTNYSDYLSAVLEAVNTELTNQDANVKIEYNPIIKNIPIQLEINSIAPINQNNSSYIWDSVADNSDVSVSNIGYNQIYYISNEKELLPISNNQIYDKYLFTGNASGTKTNNYDLAQLYTSFSYNNGLQIKPSSATYCQVGGTVKGETLDYPVLRELPLDSKVFKSNNTGYYHAKF